MKTSSKKHFITAALACLLTISLIPMAANACRKGGGQGQNGGCAIKGGQSGKQCGGSLGIWRNTQIVEDLGLNADQVSKLKDADFAAREKRQALRAELDNLHLKMEQAFSADKVDEAAVRKLSEKIAAAKGQMIGHRTETRLTLGKILTPEQLKKMNSGSGQRQGKGKGMNKPCRMNGQGRM